MIPIAITVIVAAIAVVVTILIAVPFAGKAAVAKKVREDSEKIGTAEEKARNIIDEAIKSAEAKKREALVEAKEESLKLKNEHDREYRERRAELQKYEKRVLSKEESVDKKAESMERRENHLAARETELKKKEKHVDELQEQRVQELERISGLTSEQAKEYLLKLVEEDVKHDTARNIGGFRESRLIQLHILALEFHNFIVSQGIYGSRNSIVAETFYGQAELALGIRLVRRGDRICINGLAINHGTYYRSTLLVDQSTRNGVGFFTDAAGHFVVGAAHPGKGGKKETRKGYQVELIHLAPPFAYYGHPCCRHQNSWSTGTTACSNDKPCPYGNLPER